MTFENQTKRHRASLSLHRKNRIKKEIIKPKNKKENKNDNPYDGVHN